MDSWLRLPPDAVSIGFLEAGASDSFADGWVHEKWAPASVIAVALRGRYDVVTSTGRVQAEEGEAFLVQDRQFLKITHHARKGQKTMGALWLHARFLLFHAVDLLSLFALPPKLAAVDSKPLVRAVRELLEHQERPGSFALHAKKVEVGFRVFGLLAEQAPLNASGAKLVEQSGRLAPVFAFIHAHLTEPLTIHDLARAAHLSRSRFFACFHQSVGLTPMEFLKRVRISKAREQLISTEAKLSVVAEATGFANAYHLSREFKRVWGYPPAEFRRQHRKLEV